MPRIVSTAKDDEGHEAALAAELARELERDPSPEEPFAQPIIFERDVPQTKTVHVTVVWEKWRSVGIDARDRIIMQAYEKIFPDKVDQITIAMGMTTDEAVDVGLLPYGIEPMVRAGELTDEQVRTMMRNEGAVETPSGLQLRFPSLELANRAYERLAAGSDQKHWSIVHILPPAESA